MNKLNQKPVNRPEQKARTPEFLEMSTNPWFYWNLNHIGFYVNDQPSGLNDTETKKAK